MSVASSVDEVITGHLGGVTHFSGPLSSAPTVPHQLCVPHAQAIVVATKC